MKLFIDVDNTILEHSHFYSKNTENRTHKIISKDVEVNKKAIQYMYESSITSTGKILKDLWNHDNVYILTKYPNEQFDYYKQQKLAHLLEISIEELLTKTDSEGINKYLSVKMEDNKIEYVKAKFKTKTVENFILIDDYSQNIIEWESEGAIAIKFFNEYNSPTHPTMGLSISDFKVLDIILNKKRINKLYFNYANPLMMEMVSNNILHEIDCNPKLPKVDSDYTIIDMANEIYLDSLQRLGLHKTDSHTKYNYLNFIREYYGLMLEHDKEYWINKFAKHCNDDKFLIFKSPIKISIDQIFKANNYQKEDYVAIKLLSHNDETKLNYDLYMTLNENKYYVDSKVYEQRIKKVFMLLFQGLEQ